MNIVFMGTPSFALPSLISLLKSKHKVLAVVTAPDKERGRGQKVSYTPVKEYALANNLHLLQPGKMRDESFIAELKKINADLFVVVAFKILPPEVFNIPPKGSFNLHASLLPKYRGAAPIQWAIINGEKETGVTTFALEEKVDTGNIFLQEKIKISDDDNSGTMHDKLSILGAELVLKTVNLIESGNYILKKQDNAKVIPAPKITRETGKINWNNPAENIHNLVRGLAPNPGAYFYFNNKLIKIFKTEISDIFLNPGEIKEERDQLFVGCSNKSLKILELQLEGKKKLNTTEFLRGFSFN